jgi:cysteine-rich repeat protein
MMVILPMRMVRNDYKTQGCIDYCMTKEIGWTCATPGQPCVKTCPNGTMDTALGEKCEDGNNTDGDGCSADCSTIEPGYVCLTFG